MPSRRSRTASAQRVRAIELSAGEPQHCRRETHSADCDDKRQAIMVADAKHQGAHLSIVKVATKLRVDKTPNRKSGLVPLVGFRQVKPHV